MKEIVLFITIGRRAQGETLLHFFRERDVAATYSVLGNGTARQKTLDLLGLEATEKAVHLSLVTREKAHALAVELSSPLHFGRPGTGVAVAIPVSSMNRAAAEYFADGQAPPGQEENSMEFGFELIVAIADSGRTELVMDAARKAGATGGTTVHAKGTIEKNAEKFFGVSIAEEKEIVLIVAPAARKRDIMKGIFTEAGPDSKAHTLLFSLPVSEAAGFWEAGPGGISLA